MLLWFKINDLDTLLQRIEAAGAAILDGPLFNPNAQQLEVWLRGPEGIRSSLLGPELLDANRQFANRRPKPAPFRSWSPRAG